MRNILIVLNSILFFALMGVGIHTLFFAKRVEIQAVKPVKRTVSAAKRQAVNYPKQQTPQPPEELIRAITAANIFNQDRSPNSGARGRSNNANLTLVGTFKIGKAEGAIIRVKGVQNRFFRMGGGMPGMPGMMPGMMPPPMMFGGGDNNAGGGNRAGNNGGGFQRMRQRNAGGMMSGADNRMRYSSMLRQMQNPEQQENSDTATTGVKQYIKVGETLSTGHTLIEVTRFKAVLSRGGSKTELTLEDPSKNQQRTSTVRRVNANQQFMQNSLNTQRQMMQMMQQMQHGINMNNRMMMNNMNRGSQGGGRGGSRR